MYKLRCDDRSGSRTGPEVMTGETTQLASSVRPDFGNAQDDRGECMSAVRLLTCLESPHLGLALTGDVKRSPERLLVIKSAVGRTPLGTRGELRSLAVPRGSGTSSSDKPTGQCRRRAVLGKTRCPVRRGRPADVSMATLVRHQSGESPGQRICRA